MEGKKILIVGIDPGTTLGYAVLGIEGNLVKADSSKNIDLNSLISGVIELGKVVVVGTDKKTVPDFVNHFATKLGARLIAPAEDLKVIDKKELTNGFNLRDEHQTDALASALFSYKKIKPLLKKVDVYAENYGKQGIKDRIKEMVLLKKISIKNSVDIIEQPEKEEVKIIKKVIEEKKLYEEDFIRLYNKLKRHEKDFGLLKQQNEKLIREIENAKGKERYLEKKMHHLKSDEKSEKLLDFKEKRILSFDKEIKNKDKEISDLKEEIGKLTGFLFDINKYYFLKRLNNLGFSEFEKKKKILNIKEGDILFVDDINLFSYGVIEFLKEKINIIVSKSKINEKTRKELPFILIANEKISAKEEKNFVLAKKAELDRETKKADILKRIVDEYKKERIFC